MRHYRYKITVLERRSKFQIYQTIEEVKDWLKQQKSIKDLENLQALYLFQIEPVKILQGIAEALGKSRATIDR